MVLTREQIEAADDLPFDDVPIPEWGGDVRLKMLNGEQRETIEIRMNKCQKGSIEEQSKSWKDLKPLILSFAIVDENGKRQFEPKDVSVLGKKNGDVLDRLYNHVIKQNAFSKEEADALAKNSD